MAGINKAILIGNLGQDPELKYMPSGDALCNFTIATTESWKDKDGVSTGPYGNGIEWLHSDALQKSAVNT